MTGDALGQEARRRGVWRRGGDGGNRSRRRSEAREMMTRERFEWHVAIPVCRTLAGARRHVELIDDMAELFGLAWWLDGPIDLGRALWRAAQAGRGQCTEANHGDANPGGRYERRLHAAL